MISGPSNYINRFESDPLQEKAIQKEMFNYQILWNVLINPENECPTI